MRTEFRVLVLALTTAAVLAVLCASASAQITVGQVAPTVSPPAECEEPLPFDELQTAVSSGTSYAVPTAGVITSWSTNASAGLGQRSELKIFRPSGPGTYSVVAHDGPQPLAPSVLNVFPVGIPVQAGDVVGLHTLSKFESSPTACLFETGNLLDRIGWREGNAADGAPFMLEEEGEGIRTNVSASLLPPPALTGLLTTKGSVKGGTPVVIAGLNLAAVKAVSFGAVPATSFTVNSEAQITAISPPSTTLSAVPVSVTTVAGTAVTAATYSYEGCRVPKLSHKKLKASKKQLKKGTCKLGKVKKLGDATAKTGKVVKQSAKPGTILAPGSKITIKLG